MMTPTKTLEYRNKLNVLRATTVQRRHCTNHYTHLPLSNQDFIEKMLYSNYPRLPCESCYHHPSRRRLPDEASIGVQNYKLAHIYQQCSVNHSCKWFLARLSTAYDWCTATNRLKLAEPARRIRPTRQDWGGYKEKISFYSYNHNHVELSNSKNAKPTIKIFIPRFLP